MVRIDILSGLRAGERCRIARLPCVVGRSAEAHLCLAEAGVWDKHLELEVTPSRVFSLRTYPDALVTVNGVAWRQGTLRNGDLIELGAVRLQFWLSETQQRALWPREALTWAAIAVISLSQIAMISWLIHLSR